MRGIAPTCRSSRQHCNGSHGPPRPEDPRRRPGAPQKPRYTSVASAALAQEACVPSTCSAVSGTQVQPLREDSFGSRAARRKRTASPGPAPYTRKSKLLQIIPGCAGASDALRVPLFQVRDMRWPLWVGTPVTTGGPGGQGR